MPGIPREAIVLIALVFALSLGTGVAIGYWFGLKTFVQSEVKGLKIEKVQQ